MANEPGKIKEQLDSVYEYCFVETVPYAFFKPNPARDIAVNLRAKEYRCPACGKVTRVPYRYHGDTYFSKGKLAAERRTYDKLGLDFPTMGRIVAGEPFVNEAVGYCAACAKERLGVSEDPAQRAVNLAQQLHRADALVATAARLAMEEALRRWLAAADAETLRQFDVSTLEKTRDLICAIDGQEIDDYTEASKLLLLGDARRVTVRRADSLVSIDLSGRLVERVNKERVKSLMSPRIPFVVKSFTAGSTAERAGMMPGDSVVSLNGVPMTAFSDITAALAEHKSEEVVVGFYRGGVRDSLPVMVSSAGKLGVQCETDLARLFPSNLLRHTDYSLFQAIPEGISHGWQTLMTYVTGLKMVFAPGGVQNLGGFGSMANLFPEQWNWHAFWELTALLALVLAFMNFIPIPGLDGGHIFFTLWEIITRRKPSDKFLSYAQSVGMFLLLALMILANGNDLWRWLSGSF